MNKKSFGLGIMMLFLSFMVKSQTYVNNFALTDIQGVNHDLYSYLNAGKMVVFDVSQTWCVPCWDYHETQILDDFYAAHGPNGDNSAMVFLVEIDLNTGNPQLNGAGGNTQGDWVGGTNYPIIDLDQTSFNTFQNSAINTVGTPQIYVICPNRIMTYSGNPPTLGQLNGLLNDCPTLPTVSNDVAVLSYEADTVVCKSAYYPKVRIQNVGSSNLTNSSVTIKQNGSTISTGNFSGNLSTFGYYDVYCSLISSPISGDLEVSVSAPNDLNSSNNTKHVWLEVGEQVVGSQGVVKIITDGNGDEIEWILGTDNGTIVAQGGPYVHGTYIQSDVIFNVLPDECYTLVLMDHWGNDGFDSGAGDGSVKVQVNGVDAIDVSYWNSDLKIAKMSTYSSAGMNEFNIISNLNVFPNPVNTDVTIQFESIGEDYNVKLTDLSGRELQSRLISNEFGEIQIKFNTETLQSGSYLIVVSNDRNSITKKITKL